MSSEDATDIVVTYDRTQRSVVVNIAMQQGLPITIHFQPDVARRMGNRMLEAVAKLYEPDSVSAG